jgi:hypothetical protein
LGKSRQNDRENTPPAKRITFELASVGMLNVPEKIFSASQIFSCYTRYVNWFGVQM